jgi:outer membrane murein-binding lipoprotein Lpp
MKRPRVPYARRSAWTVIAILAAVVIVGFVVAGYEIHHLQSEINGLQNNTTSLQSQVHELSQLIVQLANSVHK